MTTTSPALFAASGLSIAVGERLLFENLSLKLEAGECLAFRGPSGIGKTSLLRCLNRLQDPRKGELRLQGKLPEELGWPSYRRQVLLLPQSPLFTSSSLRDALELPFHFESAQRPFPEEEACSLLKRLGLPKLSEAPVARDLSQGEKQRLSLIRALLLAPRVLLLDEPTSSLDPESVEKVEALLLEKLQEGLALILVTHGEEQARRLASREIDLSPFVPGGAA